MRFFNFLFFQVIFVASIVSSISICDSEPVQICEDLVLRRAIDPPLKANEKAFVCITKDTKSDWRKIPLNQRKFHFKRLLQDRGYHHPTFSFEKGTLLVRPGPISYFRKLQPSFVRKKIPLILDWTWEGRPITPKLLDEIENRIQNNLLSHGFPCSQVEATCLSPRSGIIRTKIDSGSISFFRSQMIELDPVITKNYSLPILSRYFAFTKGQTLNETSLFLTTSRMESSGILEGAYFIPRCQKKKNQELALRGIIPAPRLFKVGIGIDTEGYLKGRILWQHSRLDTRASALELSTLFTFYIQQLSANLKWYITNDFPRMHLSPQVRLERKNESDFEYYSLKSAFYFGTSKEFRAGRVNLLTGPALFWIKSVRGYNKGEILLPVWEIQASFLTHEFEKGFQDPVGGFILKVEALSTHRSVFSDVSATRVNLFYKHLWNIGSFYPPIYIFGLRLGAGTSFHEAGVLPSELKYHLGGFDTLRGFSRLELPGAGNTALSSVYLGLENRFPSILPWNLEPLAFIDIGNLSSKSLSLSSTFYASPGIGLRWDSPIGVFHGTLSHGFIWGEMPAASTQDNTHLQVYLGYGQEF